MNWLTAGAVGAALLLGSALASAPAQAVTETRIATKWRRSQLKACRNSAQDDYWVAIATCDNDAAEDPQGLCPKAASQDLKAARADCGDQLDARQQICDQLGGGKYNPVINPANFSTSTNITNPYFPLKPGTTFVYEGNTAAGLEHDEFQVTRKTHTFLGVKCVEVHDKVSVDGVLTEDTLDWFAQDKAGNVWYFGEESKQLEDGIVIGIEGSWQTGVDGAKPGIVMEAKPKVGDNYRQEYTISDAEDNAEVIATGADDQRPRQDVQQCARDARVLGPRADGQRAEVLRAERRLRARHRRRDRRSIGAHQDHDQLKRLKRMPRAGYAAEVLFRAAEIEEREVHSSSRSACS